MYSLRILSKGKVTDLSNGFAFGGVPFTVFVRPKGLRWKQVRCLNASSFVIKNLVCSRTYRLDAGAIAVISPNGIDLSVYDVYWGAGETIK